MAMTQTIRKIKSNLLFNKVNRLEDKIDKLQSYIPVKESKLLSKNQKYVNNIESKSKMNLLDLEINSKVREYYNDLKAKEINKLEELLYWNLREVKESYLKNHDESLYKNKTEELFNNHDLQLKKIDEDFSSEQQEVFLEKRKIIQKKYLDEQIVAEDVETFEAQAASILQLRLNDVQQQVSRLNEQLEDEKNKKIEALTSKTANAVLKLQNQHDRLLEKLKAYRQLEYSDLIKKHELAEGDEKDQLQNVLDLYDESSETHLIVEDLLMQFGGLKAVNHLTFSVKRNEIFGLIGPNGAGKTTVFNCITQFYKPTSGKIYFKNKENEVFSLTDMKVHNVIKYGIVRTFQNVELIWELSVLDNLLVGAHTSYRSGFFTQLLNLPALRKEEDIIRAKALKILKDLNLQDFQHSQPLGLPYGVLKRIELARTLMLNPELIILDEPAAGLNDTETVELSQIIKRIRDEYQVTIFLVEHDMGLVMDVCDHICAISFGKKLAFGTPKEIQNNKSVQEAYLGGAANV